MPIFAVLLDPGDPKRFASFHINVISAAVTAPLTLEFH
jgi:hypothetical protein